MRAIKATSVPSICAGHSMLCPYDGKCKARPVKRGRYESIKTGGRFDLSHRGGGPINARTLLRRAAE
jgi:hypothetical protein